MARGAARRARRAGRGLRADRPRRHSRDGDLVGDLAAFHAGNRELYRERFFRINPRSAYAARAGVGEIFYDAKIGERRDVARHPYYGEYLAPSGLAFFVAANLVQETGRRVNLTIQRGPRAGHVDRPELERFARLLPHMISAWGLGESLARAGAERDAMAGALDADGDGAILVGADGRARVATRKAEAALRGDGPLRIEDGALAPAGAADRAAWFGALRAVLRGGPERSLRLASADGATWRVRIAARPDAERGIEPGFAIVRLSRERPLDSAGALRRTLGLTPAEASLALALADGKRLADYARERSVAITTARTHLAALRAKLEARTQAAVVARVLAALR